VEGEKRKIMYNATPKNGKPFVINEIRSSIHISTMLSFEGTRGEGLAEENVISPRYDKG
jgi:hypothetical protein